MSEIYQKIWDSDINKFSVSARNAGGEWENPDADILLDEQIKASGKRQIDLATNPLFYRVNEDKLFDPNRSYLSFIQLLDNYAIHYIDPESTPEKELEEIQNFLNFIIDTPPIEIAREYINAELGENFSQEHFRAQLYRLWFELYTNYYNGKSVHYCSGFEHVFVGEAKYNQDLGDKGASLGQISGYHSWVKFYIDEQNQRVNFLGYKYDVRGRQGADNPDVATLQMLQYITDMQGNVVAELLKKIGGFFVGPSPECEMAMATVAFLKAFTAGFKISGG